MEFYEIIFKIFGLCVSLMLYLGGVFTILRIYGKDNEEETFHALIPPQLYKREKGVRIIEILCIIWLIPMALVVGVLMLMFEILYRVFTFKLWGGKS